MRAVARIVIFLAGALMTAAPITAQTGGGTTTSGVSNTMNPAISVNSLFVAEWQDPRADSDGFKAQEFELALTSVVDPFLKANVYVAYEPDPGSPEAEVVVEEAYVDAMALPRGFGLRAGRFYLPLGRHNQLHTHNFPFVNAVNGISRILGEESVSDVGVDLTYAPGTPWYLNLHLFAGDGATEDLFDGESRELVVGGRVESLWELGESATIEGGVSLFDGPDPDGDRRSLIAVDSRFKWRDPRKTHGRAVEWLSEVLVDVRDQGGDDIGLYSLLRFRVARSWWVGGGYSLFSFIPEGVSDRAADHEMRGQLAYAPSEFSALRLDLSWLDPEGEDRELAVQLQLNFTIGSHPAHAY